MTSPTIIPTKGYHVYLSTTPPVEPKETAVVPVYSSSSEYYGNSPVDQGLRLGWNQDIPWYDEKTPTTETLPEDNIIDVIPVSDEGRCFIMHLKKSSQCKKCQIWTRTMHNPVDDKGNAVLRCQECCEVCK